MPLHLRTADWYANYRWLLLPERVRELSTACANDIGFLRGVTGSADEMASYFAATFYLTANTELTRERLRVRDGEAHATRFAAFPSVEDWQHSSEHRWVNQGCMPLDSSVPPSAVADAVLRLAAAT